MTTLPVDRSRYTRHLHEIENRITNLIHKMQLTHGLQKDDIQEVLIRVMLPEHSGKPFDRSALIELNYRINKIISKAMRYGFALLLILFGAAFLALLAFIVPIMMITVAGGIIYFLFFAEAIDKNKAMKGRKKALVALNNHPALVTYLEGQNLTRKESGAVADVIGEYTKFERSKIDVLILSGETKLGQPLIKKLYPQMFHDFVDLEVLILVEVGLNSDPSHPLYLQTSVFDNLEKLRILDLSQNQLTDLPADLFDNMPSLAMVYLDQNPITPNEPAMGFVDHPTIINLRKRGVTVHSIFQSRKLHLGGVWFTDEISLVLMQLSARQIQTSNKDATPQVKTEDTKSSECSNCGTTYDPNQPHTFCQKCGSKLDGLSTPLSKPEQNSHQLVCSNCGNAYDPNQPHSFCQKCGNKLGS